MTRPVDLTTTRWLNLCALAERAVVCPPEAKTLLIEAGKLTTLTPQPHRAFLTALANGFRWDCSTYALASPAVRGRLANGLIVKAREVRAALAPAPDEARAALAAPEEGGFEERGAPAWTARKDIGG